MRPDYCPRWGEPCQKGCEVPCTAAAELKTLAAEKASLTMALRTCEANAKILRDRPGEKAELESLRAQLAAARAERDAIRELMNSYNLGGWTDAVAPMQRALKAEAEAARLRTAGQAALRTLESVHVFVTSKERIHRPSGEEWFEGCVSTLRAALTQEGGR